MKGRRLVLLGRLALGGVLMLAVWALLVWVASRPALKALFDLTPQRVNSVDPVTEELLRDLRAQKATIEFHLFAPPLYDSQGSDNAARQSLAIRQRLVQLTQALLKTYQYLGAESVTVHDYDWVDQAEAAREAAMAFGYKVAEGEALVVAVAMSGKERRFRKVSLISDLAIIDVPNTGGAAPTARDAVPVLRDYVGEEGISSALKSLLVQGTPVAYLLDGYAADIDLTSTGSRGYRIFVDALDRAGFEMRRFNFRDEPKVPADATVVIVLAPRREFTDRDATMLFEYVQRGGRVFITYAWHGEPDWNPTGGRFGELLGYELSQAPVFHLIPTSRTAGRGTDGDQAVATLQVLLRADHATTRRLAESRRPVELAGAREVRERGRAPAGITRTSLLRTGDHGWLAVPLAEGQIDLRAPQGVALRSFEVGMAFEVPALAGGGADERAGQVVVIGGEFCNNAGMQAGFGDLALNICNWMAERRVLLDIRGSAYQARHLVVQPAQLVQIRNLLVFGVPGTFLVLGLIVFFVRRRQ